ncbi:hypothetical protein BDV96DRAFT_354703 [Lophiotrema nucula]|uniref:Uncharacterized protein n=1 Tax=Lophiotrema nucula TaxID=690887 RepID=A0A6A5YF65_9PLEO|nr:hypothetical protein BDV96DRAFT_354703 [Lophiotrema nucula]
MESWCSCYNYSDIGDFQDFPITREQYRYSFWDGLCQWLKQKCPDTCKSLTCGTESVDVELVSSTSTRGPITTKLPTSLPTTRTSTTLSISDSIGRTSSGIDSASTSTSTQSNVPTGLVDANNNALMPSQGGGLTAGAKSGIAIGTLVVAVLLGLVLRYFLRGRWKRSRSNDPATDSDTKTRHDQAGLEVADPRDPMLYRRSELDSFALGTEHPAVKYRYSFQEIQGPRVEVEDPTAENHDQAPSELPNTDVALLHADAQLSDDALQDSLEPSIQYSQPPPMSATINSESNSSRLTAMLTKQEEPSRLSIEVIREDRTEFAKSLEKTLLACWNPNVLVMIIKSMSMVKIS